MANDIGIGVLSKAGIAIESVPGTFTQPTDLLSYISEGITDDRPTIQNNILRGEAGRQSNDDPGISFVAGDIVMNFLFGDTAFNKIIKAALGSTDTAGTTNRLAKTLTGAGTSLSVTVDKGAQIWQFAGGKINVLTITGAVANAWEVTANFAFTALTFATTNSALAALTGGDSKRAIFQDLTFFIEEQGTGTLDITGATKGSEFAASKDLGLSTVTLVINNNLKTDDVTNNGVLEARRNNFRDVTLNGEVPRYTPKDNTANGSTRGGDQLRTWRSDNTRLQIKMRVEEGLVTGDNFFEILIPQLTITGGVVPNVAGPEIMPLPFETVCALNTSNKGSGDLLALVTKELELEINTVP